MRDSAFITGPNAERPPRYSRDGPILRRVKQQSLTQSPVMSSFVLICPHFVRRLLRMFLPGPPARAELRDTPRQSPPPAQRPRALARLAELPIMPSIKRRPHRMPLMRLPVALARPTVAEQRPEPGVVLPPIPDPAQRHRALEDRVRALAAVPSRRLALAHGRADRRRNDRRPLALCLPSVSPQHAIPPLRPRPGWRRAPRSPAPVS